jgi:DNA-3-methyladenine glycosylase
MGRADVLKHGGHKAGHLPLDRGELPIATATFARYFIGKVLVGELPQGVASGRLVETETYIGGDAAGNAYRGLTRRNRPLFLERGHAYVYLEYGSSYMLNVSSETPGIGAGVLIRALEPLKGIPTMRLNRGIERLHDLAQGPGRLTGAMRVAVGSMGSIFATKALYPSGVAATNPACPSPWFQANACVRRLITRFGMRKSSHLTQAHRRDERRALECPSRSSLF